MHEVSCLMLFVFFLHLVLNDNFMMNCNKYSDNELHLMSYQELRKLSILLQLPANIKKKYMISMIQAHQKGDGCTKIAIANQIMEERKVKRMSSKGKHSKTFMISDSSTNQQIPTDLSLSTKHEFETRFSYVAHYTSKDNITSGISRIIKQEAEVSRRNRSIIHHSRKPTRKLSAVDRTEIMLPRNHSLTTPVRLMPQYERNFIPHSQYEKTAGLPAAKSHFKDVNSYNCHFHGEYSNSVMQSSGQELCRNDPHWPVREVYNNPLMPILSSLLTPNSDSINSSVYSSQYTSQNIIKSQTSFQQGVYEKYIKGGNFSENQAFYSGLPSSSSLSSNNHHFSDNNNYNNNNGCRSYLFAKGDVDLEINSTPNEIDCEMYSRREDSIIRNNNGNQNCVVDFYLPRVTEPVKLHVATQPENNVEDLSSCSEQCFEAEGKAITSHPPPLRPFGIPVEIPYENAESGRGSGETAPTVTTIPDYESVYIEDKFWDESNNGSKKSEKERIEKENYVDGFLNNQTQSFLFSEVSENSAGYTVELDNNDPLAKNNKNNTQRLPLNFSRCRYVLGHNKHPDSLNRSHNPSMTLPSFLSTFCTNGMYNKAYSVCRNSFTETTETHLTPIMTCAYVSQFGTLSNSQATHNEGSGNNSLIQRQWLYSCPESQAPFSVESTTYSSWDEYPGMVRIERLPFRNDNAGSAGDKRSCVFLG